MWSRASGFGGEKEVETSSAPYRVVPGSVPATGLIDGCWISICHWSGQEAVFFNSELKKMRDEDFERHIEEMSLLGIRGVVIQNVFDSSHYVGRHEMTCRAMTAGHFILPGSIPEECRLPRETPLRRCCGPLTGVGCMCCWVWACSPGLIFRNSRWSGTGALHGSSFSGMEAMRPSMAGMFQKRSWETCIIRTCRTPQSAGRSLPCSFASSVLLQERPPTNPVAFAPNNVRFHLYAEEWKTILPFIDILIPFAFARSGTSECRADEADLRRMRHAHVGGYGDVPGAL